MAVRRHLPAFRQIPKKTPYILTTLVLILGSYFWWRPHKAHAQTDTFTTNGTWNVPAGVSSADFEAWGAGGAGGVGNKQGPNTYGGGGGKGGEYAIKHLTGLVTNDAYTINVAGVATSTGFASAVVNPSSTTIVEACGGNAGGNATTSADGVGATTDGACGHIGDTIYSGGNGANGATNGGGGGGGPGSTGNGGNASGSSGGTGTANNGGTGGGGATSNVAGNAGGNYGSGGGGGRSSGNVGGNGAPGLVTVTYTIAQLPPSAPALTLPGNGTSGNAIIPTFDFRSTDANSDYLQYEIQICSTSNCSSIIRTVCQFNDAATGCTASQTGWSGQDQPNCPTTCTAYTGAPNIINSNLAQYTPPALSAGTQYWWRAWAIDPGGSNTISSVSTIQSFTTNAAPSTPTLTTPSSGATGVSSTPTFSFSDTDPNGDDIQFTVNLFQSNCSTTVATYDMTGQTGWSPLFDGNGQTYNSYLSGTAGSGVSYVPSSALSPGVTYCWSVSALDPAGSNTTTTSGTQLFTTAGTPPEVNIGGGVNINGGTTVQ